MDILQVYAPYDGDIIGELALHTEDDIELALVKADALFKKREAWLSKVQRIKILERIADLIADNMDNLIRTSTREGGKPLMDSNVEVLRAINGVKLAISSIEQLRGTQIPMGHSASSTNRMAFTQYEPLGVVVSISAFNHPLNLIIHQTITAFAAGCPVIIKPSLITPYSCLALAQLFYEAGMPKDWCQVIICEDALAEKLATDARIAYLSFIGSAKVGWHLRSKLAPGVRCAMEHGGAAAVVVEQDADIEELVPLLTKGAFYHAGQVCVSVQRVYVHESICSKLTEALVQETIKLRVGDPLDENTEVGPLILKKELERVDEWVQEAINSGAELKCGGKRISDSCYEPSILLNPPDGALVSTREIFGPVLCIYAYADLSNAIDRANALPFAFQTAIFTKNIDLALLCANRLKGTTVMINDHTAFRVDWMPFGGGEQSGMGVGGIEFAMKEMMREKLIVIRSKGLD